MRLASLLGCAAIVAAACSSSSNNTLSGQPLDCSWVSSNNCWKTTIGAAAACLPGATADGGSPAKGTLSADGKTCTYPNGGPVVTFDSPLVLPIPSDPNHRPVWRYTMAAGGNLCIRETQPDNGQGYTVTTSVGTVMIAGVGVGLQVTCPDGTQYAAQNQFDLLHCGADGGISFAGLPGDSWAAFATEVDYSLVGTSSGSTPIFDCAE